ncbi:MAG TPA: FAD-linked oxidase C-terminal domain-containing protein [Gammaproteobacteria bacterium]|nr:FAD-linked oxidase C-terminal domain-containing protein [Gammaproteobacteria bacterium]
MPILAPEYLDDLHKLLPNKVSTFLEDIKKHSGHMFYLSDFPPDAVCYPESEQDVMTVINYCIMKKIPLIPYGSGTSVEGHTAAINRGICLNMSKMNGILEFSPSDHYVTVQPGISYNDLNDYLHPHGVHFPVEAGWGASIGGMVATNASGAGATDAGSMAKNVACCTLIVYNNGQACKITTGSKSLKSSAGYNLNNLVIGSEGTLGIITAVTLRIRSNFMCQKTIICQFSAINQAIDFVITMKKNVHFRRVELMDQLQSEACIAYSGIYFLNKDMNTLIIELAGNNEAVAEEIDMVTQYLFNNKATNIQIINNAEQARTVWMMRKNALPAVIKFIDKNKKAINTDISVPLSKLAECIDACYLHVKNAGIIAPLVAHVGDGNFHFTILVNPNNKKEMQLVKRLNNKVIEEALKRGGSCTGEHGIGIGKIPYLEQEHGDLIFLMRHIKNIFDPLGIFNPGKIIRMQ